MQGKPPPHNYFAKLGPRTGCKRLEFFDIFDIFDIAKLAKKSLNVEMSMIPPPLICQGLFLESLKSKQVRSPWEYHVEFKTSNCSDCERDQIGLEARNCSDKERL